MSVELPDSTSLYAARSSSRSQRRRIPRISFRFICLFFALAAAAAGSLYLIGYLSRPRLDRLVPAVGEPGAIVRLEGRNFGGERGESRVEIDGVSPTASSYLSWGNTEVTVRLPAAVDSGLVHVVTRHGRSNPKLFMNRARLPVRAEGNRAGRSGPYLESASTEAGPIGSLVVLTGLDFGANREDSSVLFAWTSEDDSPALMDQSGTVSVNAPESDLAYERWSDKEIRVRVPDGAVSGAVAVNTPKGRSNSLFFRVTDAPGLKRFKDRRSYSITETVSITKVKASGANELYLWAPRPVESASQHVVRVLSQDPQPLIPDYQGTALFRFKDLSSGKDISMTQSYLVQVYAVETAVDPERIVARPQDPPALMAVYLTADELVPAAAPEIQVLARRIVGAERNPWRQARLVWDWLGKNIAWTGSRELSRPLDALTEKRADSYSYALFACALFRAAGLPTLPVAGYLVDPSRRAARHYWVEIYLYGLGWVPLDPVLGAGARPEGLDIAWDDRSRYFGSLDNRHLTFSRGPSVLAPMKADGRRVSKDRRWSFQSFYEEASGALDAYSSFWGDVEVTGLY